MRRSLLRAAAGSPWLENGSSLLAGPWLSRGLERAAAAAEGPGRKAAQGRIGLSFDVDFRADVLALEGLAGELDRLDLKASFAVVGYWVREYPWEHRILVGTGHEIVNHTLTHPDNEEIEPHLHFHLLDSAELRRQIVAGHRIIQDRLDLTPAGFRTPHFGHQHTAAVYPILQELGYAYSSSTLASRSPDWGWPLPVGGDLWEVPVTVCPRHPFSSFDTWHFIRKRPSRHRPGDFLAALEGLLERAADGRLPLVFYFDPRDVAEDGDCRRALEMLAQSDLQVGPMIDLIDRDGERAE